MDIKQTERRQAKMTKKRKIYESTFKAKVALRTCPNLRLAAAVAGQFN